MYRKMAFLLVLSLFISACSSSSHSDPPSSSGSVSGNWQISLTATGETDVSATQAGSLLQSNNTVTGNLIFIDSPCSGVGGVQGSVTGSAVSLVVNPTGSEINLTGTMGSSSCTAGQTCMSGTYTTVSTGCIVNKSIPSTGDWVANLISPLSGSYAGSFVSKNGDVSTTLTAQVTQGTNSGGSSTPLSGTVTFPAGFCYSSANIVGSISGTSVVMNLVDSTGAQVGELSGTISTDGTSLNPATFDYIGLGKGFAQMCVHDDTLIGTLAIAGS